MKLIASKHFLAITDYSVTGERFDLLSDDENDFLATSPIPTDLEKYYESDDYISHTDGKRSAFEKLYQAVKSVSIARKLTLISKYKSYGNLLDIGAGTGDFILASKKRGWNVYGMEPNPKACKTAHEKGVEVSSATSHFPAETFDVITMWHVLEHVKDLDSQISELKRLLKPDGILFIGVPNFKSDDARHYGAFWAAYDVPRHLWHFSRKSMAKLFALNNMKIIKVVPMLFDAYYVSLLSEKYKTGKMRLLRGFYRGFLSNLKGRKSGEYSSHIYVIKRHHL